MINNPEGKNYQKEMVQWMLWIIKTWIFTRSFIKLLVRLGWSNKDQEIFSMKEMLELFDPKI